MAPLKLAQLNVKHLSHSFGPSDILNDINFNLTQGEVVSVVGPSGGGKTTLLHLCAGLLEVSEGSIHNSFNSFAFAFQDARLLPWQNCLDNIAFGLKAQGLNKNKRLSLAKDIALRFGLVEDDFNKFPKDLSGGMRQRVAFARALVINPELLYLDEPFSALDIGLKQELQSILIDAVCNESLSILFITHDLMEAVKLSHKMILLETSPGHISHTFTFDKPLDKRDDHYVHQETVKLLNHPKIIQTFELSIK